MSKIAIIGAGKTGRGFIARLLNEKEKEVVFIDKNKDLISELSQKKSFKVSFFGNVREPVFVDNYSAVTWDDADFNDVELIFVSVGGANLKDVGVQLGKCLNKNKHYYIITCENASDPAQTIKNVIGNENVSVSEATVFCTTIEDGGININSENYPYLQCNADLLDGYNPNIENIKIINNFGNLLERKLFTYNAASCIIAYMGWLKGYSNYGDAANDEEILKLLDKNYEITNRVMCKKFGYSEQDQKEFAQLSKNKFCDRTIIDTVARNAREPQRKLRANERIIGPAKLFNEYGEDASVLEMTAAAAILYDSEEENEWKKIKAEKTNEEILTDICGLSPDSIIYANIMNYIKKFSDEYIIITNNCREETTYEVTNS